jgi:hypothetical protein
LRSPEEEVTVTNEVFPLLVMVVLQISMKNKAHIDNRYYEKKESEEEKGHAHEEKNLW